MVRALVAVSDLPIGPIILDELLVHQEQVGVEALGAQANVVPHEKALTDQRAADAREAKEAKEAKEVCEKRLLQNRPTAEIRTGTTSTFAKAQRTPEVGLRNLADVIAFHESEGRLPVTHGKTARERALGAWLVHRRREAAQGTLSPIYREALTAIPGWDETSTRKPDKTSGQLAATGRGTRKRTTPTNAHSGYGCMDSGSTTAPAD
jgi:hypothetical protein